MLRPRYLTRRPQKAPSAAREGGGGKREEGRVMRAQTQKGRHLPGKCGPGKNIGTKACCDNESPYSYENSPQKAKPWEQLEPQCWGKVESAVSHRTCCRKPHGKGIAARYRKKTTRVFPVTPETTSLLRVLLNGAHYLHRSQGLTKRQRPCLKRGREQRFHGLRQGRVVP